MSDFMQAAISEASQNIEKNDGGPFGAVIVKNQKIISQAHNEVLKTNDPTAHAEINAIRKACASLGTYNLEGCEIYSTCEPCPMCLGAIMWAGISKIYFGADRNTAAKLGFNDEYIYDIVSGKSNNGKLSLIKTGETECSNMMLEWSKKEDKIIY